MYTVNWLAVVAAAFVPLVVGALWYGPLFGKRWLALMETTAEEIQEGFNPLSTYGLSFVLALLTAYILAQLLAMTGGSGGSAMVGVHLALMALVAFVLPVAHQGVAFERRKAALAWLNVAYNGVALVLQAVVLSVWR